MITINCTNCQAALTMDEAFAGGVCRCQYCGTIQTVPKSARDGTAGGESSGMLSAAEGTSKTLWRQKSTTEATPGTGLDELADIVASSGLAGSGLQSKRLRKSAPPSESKSNKKMAKIFGAVGGAFVALMLLVWLIFGHGNTETTTAPTPSMPGIDAPVVPVVTGPSFAGVKLGSSNTVVYIIDSGQGTSNVFTDLKAITLKSIQSLTADRKFQILFWQVRGNINAYPENGVTVAGDISLAEAGRKLDDVAAFGSSTIGPALQKAALVNPDTIIIATGKGDDLDDAFVTEVNANKPPGAKLYTFAVGNDHAIKPLQTVATQSGGEYRTIADAVIRAMAK